MNDKAYQAEASTFSKASGRAQFFLDKYGRVYEPPMHANQTTAKIQTWWPVVAPKAIISTVPIGLIGDAAASSSGSGGPRGPTEATTKSKKLSRADCTKKVKSGIKVTGVGHAFRYDTDPEFMYQCNLGGVPRRLICEVFNKSGISMTQLEALERDYLLQRPDPAVADPNEQYPKFIVK